MEQGVLFNLHQWSQSEYWMGACNSGDRLILTYMQGSESRDGWLSVIDTSKPCNIPPVPNVRIEGLDTTICVWSLIWQRWVGTFFMITDALGRKGEFSGVYSVPYVLPKKFHPPHPWIVIAAKEGNGLIVRVWQDDSDQIQARRPFYEEKGGISYVYGIWMTDKDIPIRLFEKEISQKVPQQTSCD